MKERSIALGKFNISFLNAILLAVYTCVFIYLINVPAIYSPATNSYWYVNINRYPVYVIFLRGMNFVFGRELYDISIVTFQLFFALAGIHFFYKRVLSIFSLNIVAKIILLATLLLPLFPSIYSANNICSEGLSYPFFLFLMYFTLGFLFKDRHKDIFPLLISYIFLVLTRGQFSITIPIFILIFILKYRKKIFRRPHLIHLILLLIIPFVSNTLDSTYRKIMHDQFVTTPFSYINAITLPLYASHKSDSILFDDPNHKEIFLKSYERIDSLGLLSSRVEGSYHDKYQLFHNNFPAICNLNFYEKGRDHYYELHGNFFKSHVDIEVAAKRMMPKLVKQHFKDFVGLYTANVIYGFRSIFVLLLFVVIGIYSGWKTLKKYELKDAFIFFGSLLILINALLVAFVVHTIIRYQFYYIPFAFLILTLLFNKIYARYKTRT